MAKQQALRLAVVSTVGVACAEPSSPISLPFVSDLYGWTQRVILFYLAFQTQRLEELFSNRARYGSIIKLEIEDIENWRVGLRRNAAVLCL